MSERRAGVPISEQARLLLPLAIAWFCGAIALGLLGGQRSIPLEQLMLDPAYLAGAPWYAGVVSSLGILAWCTGCIMSGFGAWVASQTGRPSAARFLAGGAAVGAVLLLDDLLQLHSGVLPDLLGGGKVVALALVTGPAAVWVVVFRHEVRRTRWLMLVAAGAAFVLSVAVHVVVDPSGSWGLLAEDGGKFLGVIAWATYFATTAVDITRSTITASFGSHLATPPASSPDRPSDTWSWRLGD